jgi:hypothetical protein
VVDWTNGDPNNHRVLDTYDTGDESEIAVPVERLLSNSEHFWDLLGCDDRQLVLLREAVHFGSAPFSTETHRWPAVLKIEMKAALAARRQARRRTLKYDADQQKQRLPGVVLATPFEGEAMRKWVRLGTHRMSIARLHERAKAVHAIARELAVRHQLAWTFFRKYVRLRAERALTNDEICRVARAIWRRCSPVAVKERARKRALERQGAASRKIHGHVDRQGRPFVDPYSDPLRLDKIVATERGALGTTARLLQHSAEYADDDAWVIEQLEQVSEDPDAPLDFTQPSRNRFDDDPFEQSYHSSNERSADDMRDSGGDIFEVTAAGQTHLPPGIVRYRSKYKLEVDPDTGVESELTVYRKQVFYGSVPIRREPLHPDIQARVAEALAMVEPRFVSHSSLEALWQLAPKTGLGFQQTDARRLRDRELGLGRLLGELHETSDSDQRVLVAAALNMRRRYLKMGGVPLDPEKWPAPKQSEPQHNAHVLAWRARTAYVKWWERQLEQRDAATARARAAYVRWWEQRLKRRDAAAARRRERRRVSRAFIGIYLGQRVYGWTPKLMRRKARQWPRSPTDILSPLPPVTREDGPGMPKEPWPDAPLQFRLKEEMERLRGNSQPFHMVLRAAICEVQLFVEPVPRLTMYGVVAGIAVDAAPLDAEKARERESRARTFIRAGAVKWRVWMPSHIAAFEWLERARSTTTLSVPSTAPSLASRPAPIKLGTNRKLDTELDHWPNYRGQPTDSRRWPGRVLPRDEWPVDIRRYPAFAQGSGCFVTRRKNGCM